MRLGWPGWWQALPAAGFGLLAASGQAPLEAWWLALPAFAALTGCVARAETRARAVWCALFAGAGYFAAALNWIVQPFMVDAAKDGWMAPFALTLMAFGLALFWAVAAAVAAGLPDRRQRALGFALTLSAAELARGYVLTGFPWALPGHIWIDTPVAQLAALLGPSGLTLLTLGLAALLTVPRPRWLGLAVLGLAASWGYGLWALAAPDPAPRGVTLRLVQPNAAQHAKWDPALAQQFFDRLLAYTAARPAADLVIWPETALPYLIDIYPEIVGVIAKSAQGVPVALGLQRVEGERGWNSLAVIGADGGLSARYDKHHLVPFGEYVPFGDLAYRWFGLRAFAAQLGGGYTAGPGPAVIDLGPKLGKVLPLICYEAVFPQDLRGTERPDWLLQITNDAWFGIWTGPFQHAAQARLRAIEQGLPLVRVANTGVTAVYDARGRQVAALAFDKAAYLDTPLPGSLPATPYARFGEGPVLLLLAGLGFFLIRKSRRPTA